MSLLLRLYPPTWRARYGAELEALIDDAGGLSAAAAANLVAGAARERLREGAIVVAQAWALFVAAGIAVQRFSEHWQDATPAGARALPAAAFDALVAGAAAATVLALAAALLALPAALRARAFSRRLSTRALVSAAVAAALTVVVVAWVHRETHPGPPLYATAAVWAASLLATLAACTSVVVDAGRRIELGRVQAWLGVGVAAAMVEMTAATCLWWAALARSAPGFAPALAPQLLAAAAAMALASAVGLAGARRAFA